MERLFNFFNTSGVTDVEVPAKLAFACLLTAVGVPMILAGEEFADQHDRFDASGHVYAGWRQASGPRRISAVSKTTGGSGSFSMFARLVKLRTSHPALSVNDTTFSTPISTTASASWSGAAAPMRRTRWW